MKVIKMKMNKVFVVAVAVIFASGMLSGMFINGKDKSAEGVSENTGIPFYDKLVEYAEKQGKTVEELTANWTAEDWLEWYRWEGNPIAGSTNITDQFLSTDWVHLSNLGNLTWGADYDYEYKYNTTSDRLEMWHNGTLVSYLGSDNLWHYVYNRPNFTDIHHIIDKEYVDFAVASLGARYYMVNTSSGISDYKLTQLSPPSGSEESITKTGLTDDEYIAGWISPSSTLNKLIKGVYNWHIYAEKTGGTKTLRLYWKLVERKSDNSEVVIATSVASNEIVSSKNYYVLPLFLNEDYELADGSYVVGKLYADVSGGGSSPSVTIYFNGDTESHWEIPVNLEIFSNTFLKLNGSNANTDIDVSPYNFTAGNISAFNLKSTASYIIWKDGSTYYAINGTTGLIEYSGSDATTVIQSAINTSGEYSKIVIKKGVYPLSQPIRLKSNMILSMYGAKLTFSSPDPTSHYPAIWIDENAENIIIEGGEIYGNPTAFDYTNGGYSEGIRTTSSYAETDWGHNILIKDVYIHDTVRSGIIAIGENILIRNCRIKNSEYDHLIYVTGAGKTYGVSIIGNTFEGYYNHNALQTRGRGIQIIGNIFQNQIPNPNEAYPVRFHINCLGNSDDIIIANNYFDLINVKDGSILIHADNVSVVGNIFRNGTNLGYAVIFANGVTNFACSNNQILGFGGDSSTTRALKVRDVSKMTISNNVITSSQSYSRAVEIESLNADVQNIFVVNNNIDVQEQGIRLANSGSYGMSGIFVINNHMDNFQSTGTNYTNIYIVGNTGIINSYPTGAILKDNFDYKTENSGSAEITGDGSTTSFTISHGLSSTPSIVLITPTNSSMASATWWVSAKSSSTFTITFSTAPSSGTKLSFDWYAEV